MKDISNAPGRYICKMGEFIHKRLEFFASDLGITRTQGHVLQFIAGQNRPVYQKDIEDEYGIRPASASQMLQSMEDAELITRVVDLFDRRKKKIIVTEKWRPAAERMIDQIAKMEECIISEIDPDKLEVFYEVMDKMLENILHEAQETGRSSSR